MIDIRVLSWRMIAPDDSIFHITNMDKQLLRDLTKGSVMVKSGKAGNIFLWYWRSEFLQNKCIGVCWVSNHQHLCKDRAKHVHLLGTMWSLNSTTANLKIKRFPQSHLTWLYISFLQLRSYTMKQKHMSLLSWYPTSDRGKSFWYYICMDSS